MKKNATNKATKQVNVFQYGYSSLTDQLKATVELVRVHWYLVLAFLLVMGVLCVILYNLSHGQIIIATDGKSSSWYELAEATRKSAEESSFELKILDTKGTLENGKLLADPSSKVNAAYLIPEVIPKETLEKLYSLGNLDFEPIWVFYKKNLGKLNSLKELGTARVGVGPAQSGRFYLTRRLFSANGIEINDNLLFVQGSVPSQIKAFEDNELDAIIFIGQPYDANVQRMINNPNAELLNFDDADAYTKITTALTRLTLPLGSLNIKDRLPEKPVNILAISTVLAVKKDVSANMQLTLLLASKDAIEKTGNTFFSDKDRFPKYLDTAIEISPTAKDFYDKGPPFLYGKLPYWLVLTINQFGIWFISLVAVLVPLSFLKFNAKDLNSKLRKRNFYVRLVELNRQSYDKNLSLEELELIHAELLKILETVSNGSTPAIGREASYFDQIGSINLIKDQVESRLTSMKTT